MKPVGNPHARISVIGKPRRYAMGWFGKKLNGSEDERKVLIAAQNLLKNGTLPEPSIRDAVSQAMQDFGFSGAKIGQPGEVAVMSALRRESGLLTMGIEGLEVWGKTAGSDAIQKAFTTAVDGLKR